MTTYPENIKLKDGTKLSFKLASREDFEYSLGFFRRQPESERDYLRRDITKREVLESRICDIENGLSTVLLALKDGIIIGDALLYTETRGWYRKTGELRVIVDVNFREMGLGVLLVGEIIKIAKEKGLIKLEAACMKTQPGVIRLLEREGFAEEGVLKSFVIDLKGGEHDLVLMGRQM